MKGILGLLALLCVGVALWFAFSPAAGEADELGVSNPGLALHSAPGDPKPEKPYTADPKPIEARPLDAEEAGSALAADEPRTGVLLRVVARGSTVGLRGAEVLFTDLMPWRSASGTRNEGTTTPKTTRLVTDAAGRVRLPAAARASVKVSCGDLWGYARVQPALEEQLIELIPDRRLSVRVVDDEGQPVSGVPLGIERVFPEPRGRMLVWRVETDTKGVATFEHVQIFGQEGDECFVTFWFPLLDPPRLRLEEKLLVKGRAELRMPPTGRVAVRAVDQAGKAVQPHQGQLGLNLVHSDGRATTPFEGALLTLPASDAEGRTALPRVGLGLVFEGTLTPSDESSGFDETRERFTGPEQPGEEVSITLVLGEQRRPVLCARMVYADGKPWSGGWLAAKERPQPPAASGRPFLPVAIAADGRVRIPLFTELDPGGALRLILSELGAQRQWLAQPRELTLDVTAFQEPRDHELGDLVLDHGPLLAEGQVIDTTGKAVEGGRLNVFPWEGPKRFMTLDVTTVRRPGGRFSVHAKAGVDAPPRLRLEFVHRFAFRGEKPREVRMGERGVQLRVLLGARVGGQVVSAHGGALPKLVAVWRDAGQPDRWVDLTPTGGFELKVPPTESGTLAVLPAGVESSDRQQELTRIEGIAAPPGAICRDPRLERIEVAALSGELSLRVMDAEGAPLPHAHVQRLDGVKPRSIGVTNQKGELRFLANGPVDLRVSRFGYQTRELLGVRGSQTLRLSPAAEFRLRLVGLPFAPRTQEELGLKVLLVSGQLGDGVATSLAQDRFEAPGDLIFRPQSGGKHRLNWQVQEAGFSTRWIKCPEQIIDVKGKAQVVEIQVPDAVRRALLARRKKR